MMIYQGLTFLILATLQSAFSFATDEKVVPVDLNFNCVKVDTVIKKTPVLLIHGTLGSLKGWEGFSLLLSLRTKRRVCAVDQRNHGDSPWSNRTDIEALTADIGNFLDKQDIQKVNIIGHSLGGKVAMHYALNNPNRVESIVIEDMRPNGITEEAYNEVLMFLKLLKEAQEQIPSGVTEEKALESITNFINNKLKQLGSTESYDESALKFLQLKQVDGKWSFKHNADALLESMYNIKRTLGQSSGVYEGPALFIYGAKSPFKIGEDKENILKLFPKAKLVPVDGAGHLIHGHFKQFDVEVINFIKGLD